MGIAFHACCLVVHPDRRDIQLYKGMEGAASERQPTIKEEGLYFFGGKNEFGEILNTLRILKIGELSVFDLRSRVSQVKGLLNGLLRKPKGSLQLHDVSIFSFIIPDSMHWLFTAEEMIKLRIVELQKGASTTLRYFI